ncbi:MAG: HAMP domain-containing sensor histidine kinase [Acidimicrobiales bacterium]|nr:HAMP domain-containing sensor histidine kinase [Acidimicrobiales bacterium]
MADPTPVSQHRRRLPRLGLRTRVILAFSIGALFLALVLSGLVMGVTRSNLVNQREASANIRVATNANILSPQITPDSNTTQILSSLQTPEGSRPIMFQRPLAKEGEECGAGWSAPDPEYSCETLPAEIRESVLAGQPAKMRFVDPNGVKSLAVGTPVAGIEGAYFEIVSLDSLDDTLSSISFTLFGASVATVLAGAAFGWYSARRILRPLDEVGAAARALAGGDLDARIRTLVDPDLEPIITSFNGMAGSLEDRIEKDAQFASDVSHELRSPLMTLQASIEVLENNRGDMNERAQAALDLLVDDLDRFRALVEDLLEISRFDAGVMHLELDEVLLAQFVGHIVRSAGYQIPVDVDEDVAVDEEFGDIVTAIDKRRIARVVSNLLSNADKYGNGPTAVAIDADDDWVRIMVDDAGEGVAEEDRGRIFERFNRATQAGRRGTSTGVGLGLALVDEHVQLHGGSVRVEDAPAGGARFVVQLPRVELDFDEHDLELA